MVQVIQSWTVTAILLIFLQERNDEDTTPTPLQKDYEKRKANILSFDGGGSKGIMEVAILDDVMRLVTILKQNPTSLEYLTDNAELSLDQNKRKALVQNLSTVADPIHPIEVFDMIVGTSTGGLIAFALVGGNIDVYGKRVPMSLEECIKMYLNKTEIIFKKPNLHSLFSTFTNIFVEIPLIPHSLHNLKKVLSDQFNDSTLSDFRDSECVAGVVARKIGQKEKLVLFDTKSDIHKFYLTKQVLLATADAPVYFETPVEIGDQNYIDGGVGGNCPLAQAIPRAQEIFGDVKFVLSVAPTPSPEIRSSFPLLYWVKYFAHQSTDGYAVYRDVKHRHKFVSFQRLTPRGDGLKDFQLDEKNAQKMLDAIKEEKSTNDLLLADVIATAAFVFNAYVSKRGESTEASLKVGAQLAHLAGKIYGGNNELGMASDSFNLSLNLWSKITKENVKQFIAETEGKLSESLRRQGKYIEAIKHANFSLQNWKAFYNDKDHENVSYALLMYGKSLHLSGKYKEGYKTYELALEMQKRIYGENVANERVAIILAHIGWLSRERGKLDKSESLLREALFMQRQLYGGDNHINVAKTLDNLGLCFTSQRKFEKGERYLQDSLKIKQDLFGNQSDPTILASYNNLGWCLLRQQKHEAAQDHLEKACRMKKVLYGEDDHKSSALTLDHMATSLAYQGQHDEALERAQQALNMKINSVFVDVKNPTIAKTLHTIGLCLVKKNRFSEANKYLMNAVKIMEDVFENKDHPELATFLTTLGDSLVGLGDYSGAKVHFDVALEIFDGNSRGKRYQETQDILNLLRKLANISEKLSYREDKIYFKKRLQRIKQQTAKVSSNSEKQP